MNNPTINQDLIEISKSLKDEVKKLKNKTILISGGSGFIGNYIVRFILHLNKKYPNFKCRVISIDNYITGSKNNLNKFSNNGLKLIEHDIRNPLKISEPIDYIIHAAGVASPIYYKKFPIETIETTIYGAKNLLELARIKKIKGFLFFSSSEIYGDPDPSSIPTPETYRGNVSCTGSRACYDESKRLGETLCLAYHEVHKIPIKIVRPFNVFGPGMKLNDYRVIPMFFSRALTNKHLPVHDNGNQTRTFCYITDAIIAIYKVLLMGKNGEIYNIGNDTNEINMMSLANIVSQLFKKKPEVRSVPYPYKYPSDEPRRRLPDLTKIKTLLNYQPSVDLITGLKRTKKWYKEMNLAKLF